MSVEEQLSNAVQAANNLTAAVNGKMGQIDQKVDSFAQNAPAIARAQANKTVFLSESGNDSNDGLSIDRPKRTLQAAVNEGLVGGVLIIYLDSDFLLEQDVSFSSNIVIYTTSRFSQANGRRAKLTAKQNSGTGQYFADGSSGTIYWMCKLFGQNSSASITIQNVDLILPEVTSWSILLSAQRRLVSSRTAFVSFGNIDGVSHYNSFNLLSSNLSMGGNTILVDGNYHAEPYQASIVRASLYSVVTTKGEGANVFGQNVWFRNGQFVSSTETLLTKVGD